MFSRLSKKVTLIISVISITLSIIIFIIPDNYFERINSEILDFFWGFLFGVGIIGFISVMLKSKKETIK
jgi:hypothetical protein